ncbi:MAG: DUF58 domain-containing protein [Solirubrobacteraceae bacterium]
MSPAAPKSQPARLALEPPAGRQGPGTIVEGLIDAIDLMVGRLVARGLPGDWRAAGVGRGTELARLRPYEPGDDVRHIDAAATARTGQPHVRLHVPERAITTWIMLDLSPSMAFGTAERLKADVAEGVTMVLARLAIKRAGSVGVVAFGAGEPIVLEPRGSRRGLVAVQSLLAAGVGRDGQSEPRAMAGALDRLLTLTSRPGLVALVSDFRDQHDWVRSMTAVAARHCLFAVEVCDPREATLPSVGRIALVDPESGRRIEVDTSSSRVRARFEELERRRREELAVDLRRLHVPHVPVGTDEDWLLALARGLSSRQRGKARA